MAVGPPLTPDFYRYPWDPIVTATVNERFVDLSWADGVGLRAFDLWLREAAVGIGTDAGTREGVVDPADHDEGLTIHSVGLDGGTLTVDWSDGSKTTHHPGWLRHVADGDHRPDRWIPQPQPWLPSDFDEPPSHHGPTVLDDSAARLAFLEDLCRFGLARLRDLPADPAAGRRLAATIGPLRGTNFGDTWDVKAVVEHHGDAATNSTANTNLRLGPHTDLPTRETPPGFQFLHCLVNETEGGESTMVDGLALVSHLEAEEPEVFEALTTLRWVFFNRGVGIDHRWSGPLIDLGVRGAPLTLRAFYPVRGFPDMDPADMPRAYAAMRRFSQLAASSEFELATAFRAGDLVAFDNRRVLHGRRAFSAGGARHLHGFYMDHDDVYSTTRALNRDAGRSHRPGSPQSTTREDEPTCTTAFSSPAP